MTALTVVYLKLTRNVLAAVTRATPPGAAEPVTALVGTALPVRAVGSTATHIAIPASELAAVTVNDTHPYAVLDPQAFQVVDDPQNKPAQQVTHLPPPAGTPPPAITLTLNKTKGAFIKVTHVHTKMLTVAAVLQKVTMPPQAATVIGPVTIGPSPGPVFYTFAAATEFATGETWDFAVFVQAMPPQAISKTVV
jgi:hypothetical protein